jgi:hypothetical protein
MLQRLLSSAQRPPSPWEYPALNFDMFPVYVCIYLHNLFRSRGNVHDTG